MEEQRTYIMTIAGLDPVCGAGLTADIKTFEQHKVYGISVCTAITLQTEDKFHEIRWEKKKDILTAIDLLLDKYFIPYVKIGIVPDLDYLAAIIEKIKETDSDIKIILDPVIRSTTGFNFLLIPEKNKFYQILKNCFLITPNTVEALAITKLPSIHDAGSELAKYCSVLLKGGHDTQNKGTDYLYTEGKIIALNPERVLSNVKHGSGCILSAAITANLGIGYSLEEACRKAKQYIETILTSNQGKLGYHHV